MGHCFIADPIVVWFIRSPMGSSSTQQSLLERESWGSFTGSKKRCLTTGRTGKKVSITKNQCIQGFLSVYSVKHYWFHSCIYRHLFCRRFRRIRTSRELTSRAHGLGIFLLILIVVVGHQLLKNYFFRGFALKAFQDRWSQTNSVDGKFSAFRNILPTSSIPRFSTIWFNSRKVNSTRWSSKEEQCGRTQALTPIRSFVLVYL